jgi:hypothetical protein
MLKINITDEDGVLLDSIEVTRAEWDLEASRNPFGLLAEAQIGDAQ